MVTIVLVLTAGFCLATFLDANRLSLLCAGLLIGALYLWAVAPTETEAFTKSVEKKLTSALGNVYLAGVDNIFGSPSALPLSRYDQTDVHVYFYFPDGKEQYLGQVRGASACGSVARSHASQRILTTNRDWSYVCCTIEAGSSCYRKIR